MRIFKEEQRFNQTWIIVLIAVSAIVPLFVITKEYLDNPESFSTLEFIGSLAIILVASCFIFVFKLYTRIDDDGIRYKFFPFQLKFKLLHDHEKLIKIDGYYKELYAKQLNEKEM